MTYDVAVVGGGAAGLTAAAAAANQGASVLLLERNKRCARKVMITGKGRCNVTNNSEPQEFLKNICRNGRFLYSAIFRFPPQQTIRTFEEMGVPLKTERGNRVFPQSDKAVDIVDALVRGARKAGVEILCEKRVREIFFGDVISLSCEDGSSYRAKTVILATGGISYPATGSTGDGYRFAEAAGHRITELLPALISMECRESWCADAAGLSLKNVTLTLLREGAKKPLYTELGEMLFTHHGVSGPLVLSATCFCGDPEKEKLSLRIDLKPALSAEKLDERILRDFAEFPAKQLSNALVKLLPSSLILPVIRSAGLSERKQVCQLTKGERLRLVETVKALPLTPVRFGPMEEAIITAGGVAVEEVDPKTMASKKQPGLYFAGELLDVNGKTGGFNLQIAFSTAQCAGMAAAEEAFQK